MIVVNGIGSLKKDFYEQQTESTTGMVTVNFMYAIISDRKRRSVYHGSK